MSGTVSHDASYRCPIFCDLDASCLRCGLVYMLQPATRVKKTACLRLCASSRTALVPFSTRGECVEAWLQHHTARVKATLVTPDRMIDAETGADDERRVTGKRRVCPYGQAEQKEHIQMQVSNMKYMYGWRIELSTNDAQITHPSVPNRAGHFTQLLQGRIRQGAVQL